MHDDIVPYEELQKRFGGRTPGAVRAHMDDQEVPYIIGKWGRPFTTFVALNKAMGVVSGSEEEAETENEVEIL